MTTITIDLDDESSITAALAANITSPELIAAVLQSSSTVFSDAEYDEANDAVILRPDRWIADDGNCEVAYDDCTGEEAAQKYVESGDWGDGTETSWITVYVWRVGLDADGEPVEIDRESHTVTPPADEPECDEAEEHDWQSPHSVVGGTEENPGVWGHGGGVIIREVCANCGMYRITDTWAQDPDTGEQGLKSVTYEDADDASLAWIAENE